MKSTHDLTYPINGHSVRLAESWVLDAHEPSTQSLTIDRRPPMTQTATAPAATETSMTDDDQTMDLCRQALAAYSEASQLSKRARELARRGYPVPAANARREAVEAQARADELHGRVEALNPDA